MKPNKIYLFFLFTISILLISSNYFAEGIKSKNNSLNKVTGSPSRTYMNINNVSTLIYNDGNSDIDPSGNSGAIFPKGSGKGAVFESGLLWGARIEGDPQVRVGGSAYRQGLQPGKILPNGEPEDPELDKNRIYRVRPDIFPGGPNVDLSAEAIDEGSSEDAIRAQYELDWNEWPAEDGAEYTDVDGDGSYNPAVDIPGVAGADQTIWFVANDLDPTITTFLYGAQPLGIEMQATFWAYAQTGALGNMFFRKYKIINKSETDFLDMYVSMWSDVDLGNSTDDFAGCDTTLSLGYCYNAQANDATYSPLPPPAVGFDFFQGPVLDGEAGEDRNKNGVDDAVDFGIFGGEIVGPGKINLPMTAFYYFARGDATVVDPTQGDPQGSTQFYNFFQGRVGLTGDPFVDPNTLQPTTFVLPGDPQTRTGWIDGQVLPGGDRRIGSASGPFTMAVGDTQEVVVAQIFAGAIEGVDRISAIGLLKFYDQQAQLAYDNFFNLPVPPRVPEVNVVELDKKIILDWGENPSRVRETESTDDKGFAFQGYNVYQLPSTSADVSSGIRIATFDIADGIGKIKDDIFDTRTGEVVNVPVQFGNDTGIRRFLEITTDALSGGTPLINGIRYYFAVTSYSYNPANVVPNNLENPLQVITVVPASKNPGDVIEANYSDTLDVAHAEGLSDGNVFPVVVDPTLLTGLTYTITFDTLADGTNVWHADRSDGVRVLENQTNQNADAESPIVDGLQFRVIGAPLDFKNFEVVANGGGPLDPPAGGALDFGGFPSIRPDDSQQLGEGHFGIHTADNGGSDDGGGERGDYAAFLSRCTRDGANWPELIPYDFEMRFTERGSIAYDAFDTVVDENYVPVPFELWNIGINTPDDPSDDYRMVPFILSNSNGDFTGDALYSFESWGLPSSDGGTGGGQEHSVSSADNDPYTDWIYWYRTPDTSPGEAAYLAVEAEMNAGTYDGHNETEVLARTVIVNWNGGSAPPFNQDMPEEGTIFRITTNKPNVAGVDVFTFTAPQITNDPNLAADEVEAINVFPNPYYAVNSEEINKYNRFVTFSHLPDEAIIRIFNIAGVHVRTIEKSSTSQFQRWDLANESGLPVASGLYIAYIDMPNIGETKILKVAIIQEQQILDRF